MKIIKGNLEKSLELELINGHYKGGFTSLSEKQLLKIKGGTNSLCSNDVNCTKSGDNIGCTNSGTCYIPGNPL